MPTTPHDSLLRLSGFLRLVKERLGLRSNQELFQHLNCDDGSFDKVDLDNCLRRPPTMGLDKVDHVIKRLGNLPWAGDAELDGLYDSLTSHLTETDRFEAAIREYLEPRIVQFNHRLLGTYLVYRAAGDRDGVARALLRIHSIRGRKGMQYTFTRLHGTHAGYMAKGRVITQQLRFMFFGYSLDPDGGKEGGLTLMALTPPTSQFSGHDRPFNLLSGLNLMSVNFTGHQAAAMKLVAVRDDKLSGSPLEVIQKEYGTVIDFEIAAEEISKRTPYLARNFYDKKVMEGMLVNNPGAGGILTFSQAEPRKKPRSQVKSA